MSIPPEHQPKPVHAVQPVAERAESRFDVVQGAVRQAGRRAGAAVCAGVVAVLSTLIRGYRLLLSPWLGSACRFEPTCSAYALQALERHGAWRGTALMGWRILRCHPGCAGGCDPVPPAARAARHASRPSAPLVP